ncbi:mismatch-specific DNA-glycosylase [Candidatus Nitrospira allomarina]|uniref:Mismatch-specific DNA-glycosylase n=1 Tax=Candidatus Nitrospira allomarina TaxID=3020900 RepID=A0AA96GCH8_9BACT|nr:mismatch-specific DNA-glycosylase [Candidatus Nitrospira allomarina]WNM57625.1 mismatch-specific DNA-glycosylase [Candidatus Nitrospira allomarina]
MKTRGGVSNDRGRMATSHPHSGLPDYLIPGLSILFVGINPGLRSAEVGHHFAGPSNRFWKLLFDAKLIPFPMTYQDDWQLPEFGYGLTNLIARPTAGVQDLEKRDFLEGHQALVTKITIYQPRLVALLGVSMARMLLSSNEAPKAVKRLSEQPIQVGLQSLTLGDTPVCVLPNPSGRNAHYSYQHMKALFGGLKDWGQSA